MLLKKKLVKWLILQIIFSVPVAIFSMETETEFLNSQDSIESVDKITPFSDKPIDFFPRYVFENPNQYKQHILTDKIFAELKKSVNNTKNSEATKKQPEKLRKNEKWQRIEEFHAWIFALGYIEENILNKDISQLITLEKLIEVNSKILRYSPDEKFIRNISAWWQLGNISLAARLILTYIYRNRTTIFNYKDKHINLIENSNKVKVQQLIDLLKKIQLDPSLIDSDNILGDVDWQCLDVEEPKLWAKKQDKSNEMDIIEWENSLLHYFPNSELIEDELAKLQNYLNSKEHPLSKAIQLWFDFIRIHPCLHGNKRTAKALSSIILLKNGYLPPIITVENSEEYVETLLSDFRANKGPVEFTKFIIRLIKNTQEKFKDKSLDSLR